MRDFTSRLYNEEGYEEKSGCRRKVSHFSGLCITYLCNVTDYSCLYALVLIYFNQLNS